VVEVCVRQNDRIGGRPPGVLVGPSQDAARRPVEPGVNERPSEPIGKREHVDEHDPQPDHAVRHTVEADDIVAREWSNPAWQEAASPGMPVAAR
jgi:hypothetical protein